MTSNHLIHCNNQDVQPTDDLSRINKNRHNNQMRIDGKHWKFAQEILKAAIIVSSEKYGFTLNAVTMATS